MLALLVACAPPSGADLPAAHADSGDTADTAVGGDTAAPCADLNCDGWPDLVVSSASDAPSTVFWGSPEGFVETTALPVVWGKGNAHVDLDGDGDLDLVIARLMADGESQAYETESYVLYTESLDPWTARVVTLPTNGAHGAAAGDLDGDGLPDLVFANHGQPGSGTPPAYVYWNGADGFSADRRLELPATGGHGVSVADVNGDALPDVVLSNYYDGRTRLLRSFVYLNDPTGLDPARRVELPTIGARGNQVADVDGDGFVDLLFANHYDAPGGGEGRMDLRSVVYWGSAEGFSDARLETFPTLGAHTVEVSDCDGDGHADLFWANQRQDVGWTGEVEGWLYRGSADGWDEQAPVALSTGGASGTAVSDLDRDGWLDLVVANFRVGEETELPSYVYWGGPDCWSDADRTPLATSSADGVSAGPGETGY